MISSPPVQTISNQRRKWNDFRFQFIFTGVGGMLLVTEPCIGSFLIVHQLKISTFYSCYQSPGGDTSLNISENYSAWSRLCLWISCVTNPLRDPRNNVDKWTSPDLTDQSGRWIMLLWHKFAKLKVLVKVCLWYAYQRMNVVFFILCRDV